MSKMVKYTWIMPTAKKNTGIKMIFGVANGSFL